MNYARGSLWSKWDLHVHTPYSIISHFSGGSEEEIWERYISDLENLPSEIKVLGINDYIFIDGYRKLMQYKKEGRLSNIDLLLPVIELRLDKFGGANNKLKRVNFHIIFSDEVEPDEIEHYFLNALPRHYELSHDVKNKVTWNSIPTKKSLAELGRMIKSTVPKAELVHFNSDLEEGFNNLNLNKEKILEVLQQHHFKDKYITTIGKTEWADIKWNDHSIADKKDIINGVDLVFISSYSPSDYYNAKSSLVEAGVNHRLLDCSDAHYNSNSYEKDKIGNCYSWLKADTTFQGLKQVLNEWDDRVYIGDIPPKIEMVHNNKGKFIHSIKIEKENDIDGWFNNEEIKLSTDLVAIIGNKGNGKSALADIIGLAGGTRNVDEFSFLNKSRFRQGNLAQKFNVVIKWENDVTEGIRLDKNPEEHVLEKVKYLPQQFLEKLCNVEDDKFENELKKVIFSHVTEKDKHQKSSLDDLIKFKTETIKETIRILSNRLFDINYQLIELEKKATKNHIKAIEELLKSKEQDLDAHIKLKPIQVLPPEDNTELSKELVMLSDLIDDLKRNHQKITETINTKKTEHIKVKNEIELAQRLKEKIQNFQKQYSVFKSDCSHELEKLNLDIKEIITLNVDINIINQLQEQLDKKDKQISNDLDSSNAQSLFKQRKDIEFKIQENQSKLDEPTQKYHQYNIALQKWEQKKKEINSEILKIKEDILYLQSKLQDEINEYKQSRIKISKEIFNEISKISGIYSSFYRPVQDFIDKHTLTDIDFKLKFDVSIDGSSVLDGIIENINQAVRGNFYGIEEGRKFLKLVIEETDFNKEDSVLAFIEKIILNLQSDPTNPDYINIGSQLKKNKAVINFYQYLFSLEYLKPVYKLKLGEKEIGKLSPGEKGALLLLFYLLVDNDETPLIIDQPEENLDNQSVYKMLVPCIKEAKKKRQIIMVTHNPNLAVVCDAEQIIHAQIDKTKNNLVTYMTGAIENPEINQSIIDILEGTKPAFTNRKSKYSLFERQ